MSSLSKLGSGFFSWPWSVDAYILFVSKHYVLWVSPCFHISLWLRHYRLDLQCWQATYLSQSHGHQTLYSAPIKNWMDSQAMVHLSIKILSVMISGTYYVLVKVPQEIIHILLQVYYNHESWEACWYQIQVCKWISGRWDHENIFC